MNWETIGWILGIWFLLSIPAGVLIGKMIAVGNRRKVEEPKPRTPQHNGHGIGTEIMKLEERIV